MDDSIQHPLPTWWWSCGTRGRNCPSPGLNFYSHNLTGLIFQVYLSEVLGCWQVKQEEESSKAMGWKLSKVVRLSFPTITVTC